ncbi:MAG: F0F1 ATP synthase subunit delta [Chloracidobacterium sp.]|nr:F0F1 ATP synthase subunit delta [Chloracidobacterium sp.]
MGAETVARRYAAALADVVTHSGETEAVREELRQWGEMIAANQNLADVLANPSIAHTKKEGVLESLIKRTSPSKTTANFLRVLLRNGRLTDLSAIDERFESVVEERSGRVQAHVSSAHTLSEAQMNELRANLEKLTGKKVQLNFETDPELIGGVVTRVGSTVYDGSVRTQLEHLREQLVTR